MHNTRDAIGNIEKGIPDVVVVVVGEVDDERAAHWGEDGGNGIDNDDNNRLFVVDVSQNHDPTAFETSVSVVAAAAAVEVEVVQRTEDEPAYLDEARIENDVDG